MSQMCTEVMRKAVDNSAPPPGSPRTARVAQLTLSACWLALNLAWLQADHGLRDGDEAGHVGAAWLFVGDLREGDVLGFVVRLVAGDMGEYPSLYPALVGVLWAALGLRQPGELPLRLANLLLLLAAAGFTGRLARRAAAVDRRDLAETVAFTVTLLSPVCVGLARHIMPEGALVTAVAGGTLALVRARELPSTDRALAAGIALGLGFLTKQTFLFYIFGPALLCLAPLGRLGLLAQGVAVAIAGPWYLRHLSAQWAYGSASVGSAASAGLGAHLGYYPFVMSWEGLGPPMATALLLVMSRILSLPAFGLQLVGAASLGGLVLTVVPKKYPRLAAPLVPMAAVLVGGAVAHSRRPQLVWACSTVASGAWLTWTSWTPLPTPALELALDPSCPQRWLSPPQADDFALPELAAAVASAGPGPILVISPPEIPCEVDTALPWIEHLRPWLEYDGLDREVHEAPPGASELGAALVVDWNGGSGVLVPVPALGREVTFRRPAATW